MGTFIAPASLRASWSKEIPARMAKTIADMEKIAANMKGRILRWGIEGDETVLVGEAESLRVLPMKDGLVVAFGRANPKGAKWKKLGNQYLPVTGRLSVFAAADPAGGSDVDVPPGKYAIHWAEGLVRLKT